MTVVQDKKAGIKIRETKDTWKLVNMDMKEKGYANAEGHTSFGSYERFLKEHKGYETRNVTGMIGSGRKVHSLTVLCKEDDGIFWVADARSWCGSQKWKSRLSILPDAEVDCKRCRK